MKITDDLWEKGILTTKSRYTSKTISKDEFINAVSISFTSYAYPGDHKYTSKIVRISSGGMIRQDDSNPEEFDYSVTICIDEYENIELSKDKVEFILGKAYDAGILDWPSKMRYLHVLDGYAWELKIILPNGKTIRKRGSNCEPEGMDRVIDMIFDPFVRKKRTRNIHV